MSQPQMNGWSKDILGYIIKKDVRIANILMRTCKTFSRWTRENPLLMSAIAKDYLFKHFIIFDTQILRVFEPPINNQFMGGGIVPIVPAPPVIPATAGIGNPIVPGTTKINSIFLSLDFQSPEIKYQINHAANCHISLKQFQSEMINPSKKQAINILTKCHCDIKTLLPWLKQDLVWNEQCQLDMIDNFMNIINIVSKKSGTTNVIKNFINSFMPTTTTVKYGLIGLVSGLLTYCLTKEVAQSVAAGGMVTLVSLMIDHHRRLGPKFL